TGDVENSGKHSNGQHRHRHRAEVSSEQNDSSRDQQGSGPRAGGDPQCRGVARLVNTEVKTSEADSGQHGHAYAFGTASATFDTRDEPDPDSGQNKAKHVP